MRKFAPASVGGIVLMTPQERLEHVAYYHERMQELHQAVRWIGPNEAAALQTISTRLIALERTVALLQESAL